MLFSVNIHGTLKYIFAIFRENSRNDRCYVNALFSVNIHGTLKYIFANFREDSRNIDVGLHVRYFP